MRSSPRDARLWTCVVVGALLALPVAAAHHLNVVDAPGHEARLALLRDVLLNGHPSPFYQVTSFFLPNIAFDVIGLSLTWLIDPESAARLFLAVTLLLAVAGTVVLNRVLFGRWSYVPLISSLLAYNLEVSEGMLNCAFGLALVPWALALRLKLRDSPFGVLAGIVIGAALLFTHVFAFATYAVLWLGILLDGWRTKSITPSQGAAKLTELAPAALLLLLMPHDPSSHIRYEPFFVAAKLSAIVKSLTCGSIAGDIAFVAGGLSFAILLALSARAKLAAPLVPGLVMLSLLFLALPTELGQASYIDKRVPIAIAFIVIAALDVEFRPTAAVAGLAGVVALAFVAKQVALTKLWHDMNPRIDAAIAALDTLPRGAIILREECDLADGLWGSYRALQPPLTHVAAYATLGQDRFDAGTWAIAGQQPIAVRPQYQAAYDLQMGDPWSSCGPDHARTAMHRIRGVTDLDGGRAYYLFVIRPAVPRSYAGEATFVAGNGDFELYRVGRR